MSFALAGSAFTVGSGAVATVLLITAAVAAAEATAEAEAAAAAACAAATLPLSIPVLPRGDSEAFVPLEPVATPFAAAFTGTAPAESVFTPEVKPIPEPGAAPTPAFDPEPEPAAVPTPEPGTSTLTDTVVEPESEPAAGPVPEPDPGAAGRPAELALLNPTADGFVASAVQPGLVGVFVQSSAVV